MRQNCFKSKLFLLHFLHLFNLLQIITAASSGSESDRLALLDFKQRISQDPLHIMSSWNSSVHLCNWTGVTCSPTNGRVSILNLNSLSLAGSIPPSIGNLSSLTAINLGNNSFHGEVPPEIGRLLLLQDLNISYNYFGGSLPMNLSHCTELRAIDAAYNGFIGKIPDQIDSLLKLVTLRLPVNNLTGRIPASIGNLSSLATLSLLRNNLHGRIPEEVGLLSGMKFFQVGVNNLSGTIPSSIYNLSSMYLFAVAENQLHGQLPSDVGLSLPKLEFFYGAGNYFTGSIPVSLPNASNLQKIDLSENGFTGTIPEKFGSLQGLILLSFQYNRLGNGDIGDLSFLSSLANCSNLTALGLTANRFGGQLPNSIGNLTQLQFLSLGSNLIHGEIPLGIGNLVNLRLVGLGFNHFSGTVPDVIGRLYNLEKLFLNQNNFSGSIPSSIGNLTKLFWLSLDENKFQGSIPPSLGNCQNLQLLNLFNNCLSGTVPKELMSLSSLTIYLRISYNFLTGPLPVEVDNLKSLIELDVANNNLSGEIPSTLGSCTSLERLHMESNMFEGTIPSLENLKGLEEIDLSHNNLSGQIPAFLSKLVFLKYLNLSYNKLHGEVPLFANQSADISVVGNDELCGGAEELDLPMCSKQVHKRHIGKKVVISVITAGVIVATLVVSSFVLYYRRKSSQKNVLISSNDSQLRVSFYDIAKSTNYFSDENLIGVGSFGRVYKAVLSNDGKIVAIKVLKVEQQGALKSFIDECNALKSIRHRNILKIITICSSVDYEGNDFKCLVYEFMPNGSLDKWLHPNPDDQLTGIKKLSFLQRLNIAIDVAFAFDYLHNHCEITIVHCDLKPNNVLLDEDMTAHVGDFGLSKFLFEASDNASQNQIISTGLRGSIGYIPPEYGDGHVSRLGDTYSYGILLLEMFTGKRPTDEMFKDDLNIHKFVSMAFPNHVIDTVDPSLLFEEENEDDRIKEAMVRNSEFQKNNKKKLEELLVPLLRIGLTCAATSPRERMKMNDVVNKLKVVRYSFLGSRDRNR